MRLLVPTCDLRLIKKDGPAARQIVGSRPSAVYWGGCSKGRRRRGRGRTPAGALSSEESVSPEQPDWLRPGFRGPQSQRWAPMAAPGGSAPQ